MDLTWHRARFRLDGSAEARDAVVDERLGARVRLTRWVTAGARFEAGAGLDRWTGLGRIGNASMGVTLSGATDRVRARVLGEGWAGSARSFGRASMGLEARLPRGDAGGWQLDAGIAVTSADAPRMLWWGAGTGRFGDALLRAHPLVHGDAIDGAAFGRGLVHLSVERGILRRIGPLRIGPALFADGAHVWRTARPGSAPTWLDAGAGLRAELGERTLRLDLAHGAWGASDGEGWVFSAEVVARRP